MKSIPEIINEQIANKTWLPQMNSLTNQVENFFKSRAALIKMFSDLEGREASYKSFAEILEIFNGEEEVLFAVLLQNMMHPKNSDRTGAIKDGNYIEITSLESAREYLASLIRTHLGNELNSAQSAVLNAMSSLQTMADLKMLVQAPDVFVAAAAMSEKAFYEGKGDRTSFFKVIEELNPKQIPDLARKLKLVVSKEFMGLTLYNDKMCKPERVNKQTIYKLWLHCCRISNALTVEQMIAF